MELSGHTVLITGGASGIGLALAERFSQHGNDVIIVGRNENKLKQSKSRYPSMTTYVCDLGIDEQLNQLVELLYDNHPKLSVLINNAGIQYNYSFMESPNISDQVREEISVNLTTPILLVSKLLPLLSRQHQAAIINVSSGLGLVPKKSSPTYCATKAGLHIFTKALRYQLQETNIKVFEIIPPLVDTDMTKGRGQNKISSDELVAEFLNCYQKNHLEALIGKTKWLAIINRISPFLAEKILKNS